MKSQERHSASLKTLLEWHGADCKYSHESKYPQLQSLRHPCLQSPGSAASGLPLPAHGRAVHMSGCAEGHCAGQGGGGKPQGGSPGLRQLTRERCLACLSSQGTAEMGLCSLQQHLQPHPCITCWSARSRRTGNSAK